MLCRDLESANNGYTVGWRVGRSCATICIHISIIRAEINTEQTPSGCSVAATTAASAADGGGGGGGGATAAGADCTLAREATSVRMQKFFLMRAREKETRGTCTEA
ncbi:hypothetical protein HZH66_003485 [Vespula vulgaris]|uniref:Uncharacterized protein n=1 Tax=Vespula vulgaris TaxID=7454 RepID=A0A834KGX3_VESVU|nr:hypothetical protein HZH66_003485 [Vespula vulgaris]